MKKKKIVIVGGGPAGLMAAITLSKFHEVHLYEKGKTLGRKFLVAGKGGFNLTNSKTGSELLEQYSENTHLEKALETFDTNATRTWLNGLGIPTYIGSSGRVFPEKGIKPIEVLNALKNKFLELGGQLYLQHEYIDFNENEITLKHENKTHVSQFDICIFALGGASWSVTGSDGSWTNSFEKNTIVTLPFEASNCGVLVNFDASFQNKLAGNPLKNIAISIGEKRHKGEALITNYGLEGNAIYPLISEIRKALKNNSKTTLSIDFKPHNTEEELLKKLEGRILPKNYGYVFKLNKVQIAFLKQFTDKETYLSPELFAKKIKKLEVPISGLRPIEEAISTVGGIDSSEMNLDLSLKKFPNVFIAGEMFDWDTITGGYLLQGCFSTGYLAAQSILNS